MPYKKAEDRVRHRVGYWKKYYADPANKAKHIAAVRVAEKKRRARTREWANAYKVAKGCRVCGFNEHPAALDFAHRDRKSKLFSVGTAIMSHRLSQKKLMAEIEKCDVVCANHHRIETVNEMMEIRARGLAAKASGCLPEDREFESPRARQLSS